MKNLETFQQIAREYGHKKVFYELNDASSRLARSALWYRDKTTDLLQTKRELEGLMGRCLYTMRVAMAFLNTEENVESIAYYLMQNPIKAATIDKEQENDL